VSQLNVFSVQDSPPVGGDNDFVRCTDIHLGR
jgi:hypothetical protein